MNNMSKKVATSILVSSIFVTASAFASPKNYTAVDNNTATAISVNIYDGKTASPDIIVTGYGVSPDQYKGPRAVVLARRAAILDAYKNIAEMYGIHITSQERVSLGSHELMTTNSDLDAYIHGAEIIEEDEKQGLYTVKMRLKGEEVKKSVKIMKSSLSTEDGRCAETNNNKPVFSFENSRQESGEYTCADFTGVVIDTRKTGKKLTPVMVAQILDETGIAIYGDTVDNFDEKDIINRGNIGYAHAVKDAVERVGKMPLILEALDIVSGNNAPNQDCNVVLSRDSVMKLLELDGKTDILRRGKVVFLY